MNPYRNLNVRRLVRLLNAKDARLRELNLVIARQNEEILRLKALLESATVGKKRE